MRLKISDRSEDPSYYAIESVRKGKKTTSKVVMRFGKRSDLLKKHSDPLAFVKGEIARMNAELKAEKLSYTKDVDFRERLAKSDAVASKKTTENVGWLYLKKIYDLLEIGDFFDGIKTRCTFSLNDANLLCTVSQIMWPGSKRRMLGGATPLLNRSGIQLQHLYRFLPVIAEHSEEYQAHLFRKTKELRKIDTQILYYDCTNFYFETEDADEDEIGEDGVIQYGLRKYGASKEHRPNPIAQMGLFTDANGIPVAFGINPGNTNEQQTTIPLEKRILSDYKESEFIYSSDGGLNAAKTRLFNSVQKRHYVVTQSLKKTPAAELDLILSDVNWRYVDKAEDEEAAKAGPEEARKRHPENAASLVGFKAALQKYADGEELTEAERAMLSRDMIYKKYAIRRRVSVSDLFPNATGDKAIEIEETMFVTFSAKYWLYQRNILGKQVTRAERDVDYKVSPLNKNPNSPKRFVKQKKFTDSGEEAKKEVVELDKEAVERERRLHGFYAVSTDLDCGITRILDINRNRWTIERDFRIMKSCLGTRPVYVRKDTAIRGHFAICYAALLIHTLLEKEMNDGEKGPVFTTQNIRDTLKSMNVQKLDGRFYQSLYTNSKTLERLEELYKLGLDMTCYKPSKFERGKKDGLPPVTTNADAKV